MNRLDISVSFRGCRAAGTVAAMTVTAPGASAGPPPEPSGFGPFAHLTVPNTPLCRHVMRTFLTAKERFAVHLRPEDVRTALPTDVRPAEPGAVVGALDMLVGWDNLRADPDTGRVAAVEDFYRKRFIYQLTREGRLPRRCCPPMTRRSGGAVPSRPWPGRRRSRGAELREPDRPRGGGRHARPCLPASGLPPRPAFRRRPHTAPGAARPRSERNRGKRSAWESYCVPSGRG